MGRPARTQTIFLDYIRDISITDLKKWGMLPGNLYATIIWNRFGRETASIGLKVNTSDIENAYVEFIYSIQDRNIRFRVPLVRVQSNLGVGYRWYFYCPIAKKRCLKLFENGDYYTHRDAVPNAMYSIQGGRKGGRAIDRFFTLKRKYDKLSKLGDKPYAKNFHNGKPTARFKRECKMINRMYRLMPAVNIEMDAFIRG